jgi:hypothetical protein
MIVVAGAIVAAVELSGPSKLLGGHQTTTTKRPPPPTTAKPVPPPSVQGAIAPWHAPLPVPITLALVLPGPGGQLLIVGGGLTDGNSAYGAFLMNTTTGALHQVGNLAAPIRDAAGAILGNQVYVFGGKGAVVTSSVQSFPMPAAGGLSSGASSSTTAASQSTKSVPVATATGALPEPRAGSVAVTIGATVYIVGGYYATHPEVAVLSTSDGGTFTTVANLPVAVRNPAVAVAGGDIYVFGGDRLSTSATTPPVTAKSADTKRPTTARTATTATTVAPADKTATWAPVNDIQEVDPVTGGAAIVGHLPKALQGATAVNLGGHIYVAGGQGPAGANGVIWGFEPSTAGLVVAGHLKDPVYDAGSATTGSMAWLVGGAATGGRLVGTVQTFRPKASSVLSPGPGSSPRKATTSTSPARAG